MLNSEFIKISKSGKKPDFKELIGLIELPLTHHLIDFCTKLHPGAEIVYKGNECQVFSKNGHYVYKMYKGCFLRTNVNTSERKKYTHSFY